MYIYIYIYIYIMNVFMWMHGHRWIHRLISLRHIVALFFD